MSSVVLVHGFCGLPEDWSAVVTELRQKKADVQVQAPHLWREIPPSMYATLEQAGRRLAELVHGDELTLVGYSLGGRVALHWPQEQWHRIKKMILIAVHGGLSSTKEKQQRIQSDETWSQKFLHQPWQQVLQEWNQQPVFAGDKVRPLRNEKDFSRGELATALRVWSLGQQQEVLGPLQSAPFEIVYLSGEKDQKFTQYAMELKKVFSHWNFINIAEAGHSVHLSHPAKVAEII
jgi:2-succinyl-6-hydroxy-2,4-cyclohexadiene-1-carboxylate synthase